MIIRTGAGVSFDVLYSYYEFESWCAHNQGFHRIQDGDRHVEIRDYHV